MAVRERDHEAREGLSRVEGSADWKAVVAAYHVDDWPPPEWMAPTGEATPIGVANA